MRKLTTEELKVGMECRINLSKEWCKAIILCTDIKNDGQPIAIRYTFSKSHYLPGSTEMTEEVISVSANQLYAAPERLEGWAVVLRAYNGSLYVHNNKLFTTEAEARAREKCTGLADFVGVAYISAEVRTGTNYET